MRAIALEPHSLGVFRWNPAATRAQNFDLAPGRQCQNAIGCVRGGEARLDVLACDNSKRAAFTAAFELPDRKYSSRRDRKHHEQQSNDRGRSAAPKNQREETKRCDPKTDGRGDAVLIDARKLQISLRPAWLELQGVCFIACDL